MGVVTAAAARIVGAAGASVALAASTGMASAGDRNGGLIERLFPAGEGVGSSCYARRYDARHLRKHPRQTVTFLAISRRAKGGVEADGRVVLRLEAEVRGKRERFEGSIYCKPVAAGSRCHVEGDGGSLMLTSDNGRLRVEPGEQGIGLEGSVFISFGAAASDDRVLLLDRSEGAGACRPGRASE